MGCGCRGRKDRRPAQARAKTGVAYTVTSSDGSVSEVGSLSEARQVAGPGDKIGAVRKASG